MGKRGEKIYAPSGQLTAHSGYGKILGRAFFAIAVGDIVRGVR